jgi:peroxiredoxin (alkyl hydroperoxide reductase subunit C)
MNLIGKKLPSFNVQAIEKDRMFTLTDADLLGSYSVLFFYPLDFTFVCPTEIHALQEKMAEFEKRGARVLAISVDSIHAHRAWLHTPKAQGGIAGVTYTLVSDMQRSLARSCDVLDEEEGVALRGTFIVDTDNVVQHATVNNLSFGRNIDEIIRMIDAMQFVEKNGDHVCPANWSQGAKTMSPTADGVEEYFGK